ncbi:hypothetical protein [uncultured Piscinibacter sp.]|uniref:hypothetical protein n=1 Tax=uncultured Piscinibacter sp. TaxID=1131835 RepID=UPI002606FD47|nr:hypothetical protein [uncultured Piscinibacter sp.]
MHSPSFSSRRHVIGVLGALLSGSPLPVLAAGSTEQKYPDVVAVEVRAAGTNTFDFDTTVSSPYDSPQRYADAFRIMSREGSVFGERVLFHDHASEQPFTRDLYGVKIPADVTVVVVQARDKRFGYGGRTVEVRLPGR